MSSRGCWVCSRAFSFLSEWVFDLADAFAGEADAFAGDVERARDRLKRARC